MYREKAVKRWSADAALFRKELARFTASPNYMLNSGLAITHPAASLHQTAPAPSAAKQAFHNLSTEFSTISSVFHSGFLSPWLSLRETG